MAKEYKNALGFTTTKEKYEAEQKAKKKAKKDEQAFYQKKDGIKRKRLEQKNKNKGFHDDGASAVTFDNKLNARVRESKADNNLFTGRTFKKKEKSSVGKIYNPNSKVRKPSKIGI